MVYFYMHFRTKKYCSSFTKFFDQLLKPVSRVTVDLYTYIFLCDFINFFVLLFGFTSFGVGFTITYKAAVLYITFFAISLFFPVHPRRRWHCVLRGGEQDTSHLSDHAAAAVHLYHRWSSAVLAQEPQGQDRVPVCDGGGNAFVVVLLGADV